MNSIRSSRTPLLEFKRKTCQGRQAVNLGSFPEEEDGGEKWKPPWPLESQASRGGSYLAADSHKVGRGTPEERLRKLHVSLKSILMLWPATERKDRRKRKKCTFIPPAEPQDCSARKAWTREGILGRKCLSLRG